MSMFNVVIQLGAILAVMVIYFNKLNPFKPTKDKQEVRKTWRLWLKVLVATLPLLAVFKFDDWFDTHFHNMVSVALMLIIYRAKCNRVGQASLYDSFLYRTLPSSCPFTRNQPFWSHNRRWFIEWNQSFCCDRIYLLSWNSCYVWS